MKKIAFKLKAPEIVLYIICISSIIFTTACTASPPTTAAEEILRHDWHMLDSEGEEYATLTFDNDRFILEAEIYDSPLSLSGECFVDKETISVDTENFGTIIIRYKLSSDELTLTYFGKSVVFLKK